MRKITVLLAAVPVVVAVAFSIGQGQSRARPGVAAEKWFLLKIKGETSGYLHVTRRASGDASAPILFEYEQLMDTKKDKAQLSAQTYCEDDEYYSPMKATAQIIQPDDKTAAIEIMMEKKTHYGCSKRQMRLVYKPGKKEYKKEQELPEHTITGFSVIELIPRLPFTEGPVVEFNFLDIEKMRVQKKHKIAYLGREKIEINGQERDLHKFEQKGSGIKKTHYWVDDNHQLLRILKGKKEELLLSTRAEAFKPTPDWSRKKKEQ